MPAPTLDPDASETERYNSYSRMTVDELKALLAKRGIKKPTSKEGLIEFLLLLDKGEAATRTATDDELGGNGSLGDVDDDDYGCKLAGDGDDAVPLSAEELDDGARAGDTPADAAPETEPESPTGPQPPTPIDPAVGPTEAVPVAAAATPAVDGAPTALADEERIADLVEAAVAKALADEPALKKREAAAFRSGHLAGSWQTAVFLVLLCGCWWCEYGS